MSSHKIPSYIIPLILFIFSFLLRLSLISKGPFHLDCLHLAINAQESLDTLSLRSQFGFGYPLTVLLGAVFIFISRLFSQNDPVMAVNLMSVVTSSLCVPVFFAISNKLFNRTTAVLSSIAFSLTPIFLGISLFGKSHAPSILFLLLSLYVLLSFLETRDKKTLIISGLLLGLMGAARLQDMVLMAIPFSFLSVIGVDKNTQSKTKKEALERLSSFWIPALILIILFHLPYFSLKHQSHYMSSLSEFWRQGITNNFRGALSSSLAVSIIFLLWGLTEIGFVLSLVGLGLIGQKSPRVFLFFLLWILIPLFFYGNLHTTVPRFFAFILPPLLIAQGYLLARLMKLNSMFRLTSAIIYSVILFLSFTTIFPILQTRHAYALLPDHARWISRTVEPNALLITSDDRLFYEYYGNIRTLSRPMDFLALNTADLDAFRKEVDDALRKNIPVYTTRTGLYAYNPDKKFSSLVEENYRLKVVGTKLYEDWHRGILKQSISENELIRIYPKSPY